MVHLGALPGAPTWGGSMHAVVERAVEDAARLVEAGLDGVMVENYGDVPFYPEQAPPETVAALAVCVREVQRAVPVPVGVNLLRNDAPGAVAVAVAGGARFIRVNVHTGVMVTDQGLLSGHAYRTLRLRAALGVPVAILADVWVKHGIPLPGAEVGQAAEDTWARGLADGLIVTGAGTGRATDLARLATVKRAVPEAPVWVGSGVTTQTVRDVLAVADGAIVGTALAHDGIAGRGVDPVRAAALVRAARSVA